MMRQYELVERVRSYMPDADENLLNRAYVYAMKAHGEQKRHSGLPYFSHPLEVAGILTDLHLDEATIAVALLHDTIEDTDATREEIEKLFGPEISDLVVGLTKIKKLDLVTKKAKQAENFRKLLMAIAADVRVLLVKLADRLHNMRTLDAMKDESRRRISQETLDIYAPLAGRMGMQELREELEELSFKWLYPDAHSAIVARLSEMREENADLVDVIVEALKDRLADLDRPFEISSREKKPYSIWRKLELQGLSMEQLSDIYGFRIITDEVDDCYRILGRIHTRWRTVPGRFKDHISNPKRNDYQSIHTTVVGPRHQRVELQIRTKTMHQIAEYGVAAHAFYKDREEGSRAYESLRRVVETLLEGDDPEEFLEHTKLELVQDQVFCFSPKGDLIALPRGATPVDFAYAVHTDVGNSAVGCLINRRQQPILTVLNNGDEVKILCAEGSTPPLAWEKVVATGRARSAIRRANRELQHRKYSKLGRTIVEAAFRRADREFNEDLLKSNLSRLSQKSVPDVFAAVGRDELASEVVLRAVYPELVPPEKPEPERTQKNRLQRRSDEGWFNLAKTMGLKFRLPGLGSQPIFDKAAPIPVRGQTSDIPVTFGEGGAIPGDRIVGILSPGKGISVYPIDSPSLRAFDNELDRWIDVSWDIDESNAERYLAHIRITALNEPGTLAQIAQLIGDADGNIDTLVMVKRAADFTVMSIGVEVWDLQHLNQIISGLNAKPVVNSVERSYE